MLSRLLFALSRILPLQLFWDLFTPTFYTDHWQHGIYTQHYWLLGIIKPKKFNRVLEVGCGFGRNLKFLIDQGIKPETFTGIDFSQNLLQLAKANLPPQVKLYPGKAQNLPFPDNYFNLTFTHGVLMHLPPNQVNQAFSELVRVSKKYLALVEETVTGTDPVRINNFTWAHDYQALISQHQLEIVEHTQDTTHRLVWYLLKKP